MFQNMLLGFLRFWGAKGGLSCQADFWRVNPKFCIRVLCYKLIDINSLIPLWGWPFQYPNGKLDHSGMG